MRKFWPYGSNGTELANNRGGGFANTPVCFASPQSNTYEEGDEALTFSLDHVIATTAGVTTLSVTRAP